MHIQNHNQTLIVHQIWNMLYWFSVILRQLYRLSQHFYPSASVSSLCIIGWLRFKLRLQSCGYLILLTSRYLSWYFCYGFWLGGAPSGYLPPLFLHFQPVTRLLDSPHHFPGWHLLHHSILLIRRSGKMGSVAAAAPVAFVESPPQIGGSRNRAIVCSFCFFDYI